MPSYWRFFDYFKMRHAKGLQLLSAILSILAFLYLSRIAVEDKNNNVTFSMRKILHSEKSSTINTLAERRYQTLVNNLEAVLNKSGDITEFFNTYKYFDGKVFVKDNKNQCKEYQALAATRRLVAYDITGTQAERNGIYAPRDITLITQFDMKRIDALKKMVESWTCPMSIILHLFTGVNVTRNAENIIDILRVIKKTKFILERQDVALHIMVSPGTVYPNNHLNNAALSQVKTDFVFLNDVDFIPSPGLCRHLRTVFSKEWNFENLLVIPAFEYKENKNLTFVIPQNKSELVKKLQASQMQPFHGDTEGHRATNYSKWVKANDQYKITYKSLYEPYIAANRTNMILFNEDFVSRGFNKVEHRLRLYMMGFNYVVDPHHFLVHHPHPKDRRDADERCSRKIYKESVTRLKNAYPGRKFVSTIS